MRVLVTGGAGFLGSHLCERLLGDGHAVVCVDNFFTGSQSNIAHLLKHKRFELRVHDVTEAFDIEAEQIYNLACPASPVQYQRNPAGTVKTSVMGAIHCLELAKRRGARVLQASTSEVYGDPTVHPQPEHYRGNVDPIGPRACYDEGKRCAETLFFDYHRQNAVDIRVVRIFNTYGPRMAVNDGRVVSNFIVQALRGESLTVYGDGHHTRSFCYVDDLIDGMVRMMQQEHFIGPINLGNPHEVTIQSLAELVIARVGNSAGIRYEALPKDDPTQRRPMIDLAHAHLAWQPTVGLEDGLKKTIAYFRKLLTHSRPLRRAVQLAEISA